MFQSFARGQQRVRGHHHAERTRVSKLLRRPASRWAAQPGWSKDRTWNTLGAKSQHEDLWLTLYTGPTGLYPSVIWSLAYHRSPRAVLSQARYLLPASPPPATSPCPVTFIRPPSSIRGTPVIPLPLPLPGMQGRDAAFHNTRLASMLLVCSSC